MIKKHYLLATGLMYIVLYGKLQASHAFQYASSSDQSHTSAKQKELNKKLVWANNIQEVQAALDEGAEINGYDRI